MLFHIAAKERSTGFVEAAPNFLSPSRRLTEKDVRLADDLSSLFKFQSPLLETLVRSVHRGYSLFAFLKADVELLENLGARSTSQENRAILVRTDRKALGNDLSGEEPQSSFGFVASSDLEFRDESAIGGT